MNKKLITTLTVSASALFLSACASDIDTAKSASEQINEELSDIQAVFVDLQAEENALQALFTETLAEDEHFETLKDQTSDLFENIEERSGIMDKLKEQQGELEEESTAINELDASKLPADLFEETKSLLDESAKALEAFVTHYSDNLSQQSEYFQSLAAEDASYETFTDGIRSINEQQEAVYEKIVALDTALFSLNETNQSFLEALTEEE